MKTGGITVLFVLFIMHAFAQEKSEIKRISHSHRTYYSEIIIDATPAQVWSVLTDFESYADWTYFFRKLEGNFTDGGTVTVYFDRNPGKSKRKLVLDQTLEVNEGNYFGWSSVFKMGMRDHHIYRVEPTSNGKTRFIQSDEAKGGFTWLFGGMVSKFESRHYPEFNRALKAEVEKRFKTY